MYIGTDGVYSYTFKHERREDCPVCGGKSMAIEVGKEWTVDRLIEMLVERQDMYARRSSSLVPLYSLIILTIRQVKKPSLATTKADGTTVNIYLQGPKSLEEATRPNLEKKVADFVEEGGHIIVTATTLPLSLDLVVSYV